MITNPFLCKHQVKYGSDGNPKRWVYCTFEVSALDRNIVLKNQRLVMKRIENTQGSEILQVVRDLRFGLCFEPASYNIYSKLITTLSYLERIRVNYLS